MRLKRLMVFDPPLAAPVEHCAERVAEALAERGFPRVTWSDGRVEFGGAGVFSRYGHPGLRAASAVSGGSVRLDPRGTHAELEVRYPFGSLGIPALVALGFILAGGPWPFRAVPVAILAFAAFQAWSGARPVERWVREALEAP
ncbi:MAG TPA: hypothetical protein VFJ82_23390 [Longimicrobium sp.]|nr:hypothetical protein [Longimicrobium sp.]